jgi:hypothetical protein
MPTQSDDRALAMAGDDEGGEWRPQSDPRYGDQVSPLSGRELLDLYINQQNRGDQSLAVEKEIVVRNFSVLGAVLLLQTGNLMEFFSPAALEIWSGLFLVAVSIASRVMSIYYARYSVALFAEAKAIRKAVMRGRNSLYAEQKAREKNLVKLYKDAELSPVSAFFENRGVLAFINLLPGAIGLILLLMGLLRFLRG